MRLWVLTTLTAASAVSAQEQRTAPNDVVVVGQRPSPEQARREATEFVRRLGVTAAGRQAARWDEPVCPRALALAPEHARRVEARMRAMAREAGARVAREGCRPNITVSFTADAAAEVARVARAEPGHLAELPPEFRPALFGDRLPVRWLYQTEWRGEDRLPVHAAPPPWAYGNGQGGPVLPSNGKGGFTQGVGPSLIETRGARVLRSAMVIVDVDLAEGAPLDAVADYAAMVALAELRPGDPPPPHSVLSLFADPAAPREPTARDRAFLHELYRMPLAREARHQRRRLVGALAAAAVAPTR